MHGRLRLMRIRSPAQCTVMAVSAGQAEPAYPCDQDPTDPIISTTVTSVEPPSLLSRLCCPQPAEISRPRKVKKNTGVPEIGNKQSHVTASRSRHNPKSSSPYQRVQEFPGEKFTVSTGKLFCCGCREER